MASLNRRFPWFKESLLCVFMVYPVYIEGHLTLFAFANNTNTIQYEGITSSLREGIKKELKFVNILL